MTTVLDRFYSALRQLSASDLASCVTEDFTLEWQGTDAIPWAGRWVGVEGLLDFVRKLQAHLEILDVEQTHRIEHGEATVVLLKGRWRIRSTHGEVQAMAANIFTFAGGRIRSYTVLNNSAAFAEALVAPSS